MWSTVRPVKALLAVSISVCIAISGCTQDGPPPQRQAAKAPSPAAKATPAKATHPTTKAKTLTAKPPEAKTPKPAPAKATLGNTVKQPGPPPATEAEGIAARPAVSDKSLSTLTTAPDLIAAVNTSRAAVGKALQADHDLLAAWHLADAISKAANALGDRTTVVWIATLGAAQSKSKSVIKEAPVEWFGTKLADVSLLGEEPPIPADVIVKTENDEFDEPDDGEKPMHTVEQLV